MKRFTKLFTVFMLVLLFSALPLQAKTIKSSDQKTAKKQIKIMVNELNYATGRKIYENLKYKKSYTFNFDKKSARYYFADQIYIFDGKKDGPLTQNTVSKWFFGYKGKNVDAGEEYAYEDWGIDGFNLKTTKITKKGSTYTAQCNVYYVHESETTGKTYNRKMGTCTFTFKLKSKTHYGLILKKAKVTRTVKKLSSLTKD